jgi:uncharacterized protein YbaR (Trm112 family)
MHIHLTDRLTCPRCGPEFGLILLAEEVRDRRVLRGAFGCANCREKYPVEEGFGDLRPPPRTEPPPSSPSDSDRPAPDGPEALGEDPLKVAALLGVTGGPGTLLVTGPAALRAGDIAEIIGDVEVVAMCPVLRHQPERDGVSRIVSGPGFPFFSGTFRGVVQGEKKSGREVEEGARVTAPLARLVILTAPGGARSRLEELGFRILLWEEGVLVAQRQG